MKRILLTMIFFISALSLTTANDLDLENLKGKVASVIEECRPLVLKFGIWVVSNEPYDHVWESYKKSTSYNELGNISEHINYNDDGTMCWSDIYNYSEQGLLIDWSEYSSNGSLNRKTVRTYDSNGNLIEADCYNGEGDLLEHYAYTGDIKDIRKITTYSSDGTMEGLITEKYNIKGNIEEKILYNANGSFGAKWTYSYDTLGHLIEDTDYYKNQFTISWGHFYTYDELGNRIGSAQYGDDRIPYSNSIYTYEYDSLGNWVKCIESEQVVKFGKTYFEPQRQTTRIITYHTETK